MLRTPRCGACGGADDVRERGYVDEGVPMATCATCGGPEPRVYESIIKVVVSDPADRRARDISEGIGYACALLMDEYGWSGEKVQDVLEDVICDVLDKAERRGEQ